MDETSGSTMFDSVGGNNGTLTNVILGQPGLLNPAYGFNGESSVVTVPDSPSLNPTAADFAVTVSVKLSQVPPGDYDLIRKGLGTTAGGDYKLEIVPTDKTHTVAVARCHYNGSRASTSFTKGPNLADGAWHTVTCIKQAISISLIVDGQTFTKPVVIGSISNSAPLTLGAKLKAMTGGDWYAGLLDEVSLSM